MLVEITRSNKKCTKCVCYFYGKLKEKRIIATWLYKRGVFLFYCLFFERININHMYIWLLYRNPILHSRNPIKQGAYKVMSELQAVKLQQI